jgi:hypothetical protein
MMQLLQRGFAALVLMVLPGLHGPAADTDGLVPDLEITVVGVKDPARPREVTLRVTNVGPAWADHTTATVQTEPSSAGSKLEEDVLDLSPIGKEKEQDTPSHYDFTYTLAAPCGGQEVKLRVSLSAGKDWEGDAEKNMANNAIPRPGHDGVVCKAQAQPQGNAVPSRTDEGVLKPPGPTIRVIEPAGSTKTISPSNLEPSGPVVSSGPRKPIPVVGGTPSKEEIFDDALESVLPEHTRPGFHGVGGDWPPLPLDQTAAVSGYQALEFGDCPNAGRFEGDSDRKELLVGWYQSEATCIFPAGPFPIPVDYGDVEVYQTAVNFDLTKLDQVPNKTIKSAVLSFSEERSLWTSGSGEPEHKAGCVEVLGRATTRWDANHIGLFHNEQILRKLPEAREFVVTGLVEQWLSNAVPRHGFVLRGGNENPRGEDDTSCVSRIHNLRLTVEYIVPQ